MPRLMSPAENGHVHWGREALSSGHARIVILAYRDVAGILNVEARGDLIEQLVEM